MFPKYFDPHFKGQPISEWGDIVAVLNQGKGKYSDAPYFTAGKPIFSEKAVESLRELITDHVQVLPILYDKYPIYAINVLRVIDCINYEKAKVRSLSDGFVVGFEQFAFIKERLQDATIFKIRELLSTEIFVTDLFRDQVLKSKLIGFTFKEVWDSEADTNAMTEPAPIPDYSNLPQYSYIDAMHRVNEGAAIASGKWKLQKDKTDNILLGELLDNGKYEWIDPLYYPPIFHELKWAVVDRSPDI
jgi:hypothetical protein